MYFKYLCVCVGVRETETEKVGVREWYVCVCACSRPKAVIWRAGAPSTFLTILEDGVSTGPGRPSGQGLKLQGTLPGGGGEEKRRLCRDGKGSLTSPPSLEGGIRVPRSEATQLQEQLRVR